MENSPLGRPIQILMAEDNPGDVRLVLEILKDSQIEKKIHVVKDGEEALSFLYGWGPYTQALCPDMILLDWNLPRKNGYELLKEIKNDQRLKHIPVVVFTTSSATEDITMAYEANANCYITKPMELDQFIKVIQTIEAFWMNLVRLPRREDHV